MISKQTLFIPERVTIELRNKNNEPLRQANILLGIKTHASYREDIYIYPLVSDENGSIIATREEIKEMVDDFISYGIMDYSPLESAKPNIEIYFWGKRNINIYLGYEIDPHLEASLRISIPHLDTEQFKKQRIEQMKQEKYYEVFNNCFNRQTTIVSDLICVNDSWNKPQNNVYYKIKLPL